MSFTQIFRILASWAFDPFMTQVFLMKKLGIGGAHGK
jgi:hypothetical protein